MHSWLYVGALESVPHLPDSAEGEACIYVLKFQGRCKIGITQSPTVRLKQLRTLHRQINGGIIEFAVVSQPTMHARQIELGILFAFKEQRLPGEYVSADFGLVVDALSAAMEVQRVATDQPTVEIDDPSWPQVRKIKHPRYAFSVDWIDLAAPREKTGRHRRMRRYFVDEVSAIACCDELRAKITKPAVDKTSDVINAIQLLAPYGVSLSYLAQNYIAELRRKRR